MKKWVAVFNSIFDEDNYTPIMVQDEIEYEEIVSIYPYHSIELEQVCAKFYFCLHLEFQAKAHKKGGPLYVR